MTENTNMTLGSLFDGSGGFPLGGLLCGITPVWASEIEPFPIRVTTKQLPFMKHYGDISTMDGGTVEPVDIISFGSPCTDMSVAGKRAGLDGSQSVLFYQAIRIIKEMRCATNGKYPRYIVWENVPGAFSSNGGADFKAVLEAVVGVVHENAEVPMPENGRWPYADLYMGNGWSVAYRTLDAQYWGVPQRRRRIYLVADFAGGSAGEILFESEGLSGYSAEGFSTWQRTACRAEGGARTPSLCLNDQGGARMEVSDDVTATLRAEAHHPPCVMESAGFCTEHSAKARSIGYEEETSPTLRAGTVPAAIALENHPMDGRIRIEEGEAVQTLSGRMGTGGMNVPLLMSEDAPLTLKIRSGCEGGGKGALIQEDKSATLSCNNDQTVFVPSVYDGKQVTSKTNRSNPRPGAPCHTLAAGSADSAVVCYGICSDKSNAMLSDNPHSGVYEADSSRTLDANGGNPSCNQGGVAVVEAYALQGSMIGRSEKNGPQGDGVNEDVSFTLNTIDRHAVYALTTGSFTQVSENTAPTLLSRDYKDATVVSEPAYGIDRAAFNQGRNAQYKPSIEEEQQPTLTAKGPGAVAQPASFYPQMKAESQCFRQDGTSNTLVNGTNPGYQNGLVEPGYSVRRLTPTECARLQGFPDWWCDDLGTDEPTDAEIAFWSDVWETHRVITGGSSKPKTRKQIVKWLQAPHSDAAEYKMWGNGVALPCVFFVLAGVVWASKKIEK